MAKRAVSVTLDQENLLWLSGRAAGKKRRSLSEAIDEVITQARRSGQAPGDARSVVGTIDIAADDPLLERADEYVRAAFEQSLGGRPRGGSRRAGGTGRADRIPHGKTRRG